MAISYPHHLVSHTLYGLHQHIAQDFVVICYQDKLGLLFDHRDLAGFSLQYAPDLLLDFADAEGFGQETVSSGLKDLIFGVGIIVSGDYQDRQIRYKGQQPREKRAAFRLHRPRRQRAQLHQ